MMEDIEQSTTRQPVYMRYTLIDMTPVAPERLAFLRERVGTNNQHPLYQELVLAQARHDGTAGWMTYAWHGDGVWRYNRDELNRPGDFLDVGANAKDVWLLSPRVIVLTTKGAPPAPERDYSTIGDESLRNVKTLLSGGLSNVWDAKAELKYVRLPEGRWRASGVKQRGNFELRWEAHGREPGAPGQAGTIESVRGTGFMDGQERGSMSEKSEGWRTWDDGLWAPATVTEFDASPGMIRKFQLLELRNSSKEELEKVVVTPRIDQSDPVRGEIHPTGLDDFRSRTTVQQTLTPEGQMVERTIAPQRSYTWLKVGGWALLCLLVAALIYVRIRAR